jgi:hypothetical protein
MFNLKKDLNSAMIALNKMEGPGFAEQSLTEAQFSLGEALEFLKKKPGVHFMGSIYGSGGINRYFVLKDGTLQYSRSHGWQQLDKAVTMGFEID